MVPPTAAFPLLPRVIDMLLHLLTAASMALSPMRTAPADSLTVESMRLVAKVHAKLDSAIKADSTLKPATIKDEDDPIDALTKRITDAPTLGKIVKAAGFEAATYATQYQRLMDAWQYVVTDRELQRRGIKSSQIVGAPPPPPAADIAFVKQHEADLKTLGFPEPKTPKFG